MLRDDVDGAFACVREVAEAVFGGFQRAGKADGEQRGVVVDDVGV